MVLYSPFLGTKEMSRGMPFKCRNCSPTQSEQALDLHNKYTDVLSNPTISDIY